MALLVVLDSLTPAERVSFVLHDVYRYPFAEIAEIVGRTPEACRQLATSARRRIGVARTPPPPGPELSATIRAFKVAWEAHDIQALVGLLDPDATATADGGGLITAELRPVTGAGVLRGRSSRLPQRPSPHADRTNGQRATRAGRSQGWGHLHGDRLRDLERLDPLSVGHAQPRQAPIVARLTSTSWGWGQLAS